MKRYLIFMLLSFGAIVFYSCQKDNSANLKSDYTCRCSGGMDHMGKEVAITNATKTEATYSCNDNNTAGPYGYYDCQLH